MAAQKNTFRRRNYTDNVTGITLILGNALDKNTVQYERWSKEKKGLELATCKLDKPTDLTGEIVVAGVLDGDNMQVLKITELRPDTAFKVVSGDKSLGFFSSASFKGAEEKKSKAGNKYHRCKFSGGDNKSIIITCCGFTQQPENSLYAFAIQPAPDGSLFEKNVGTFEIKGEPVEWTTFYGFAATQFTT